LDILLFVAGIIAVISIIWAGFEYLTSMGNSDKGVSARKRIINSIIGLAIVLIATSIVTFIGSSFTEIK
jgi:type IV secretory pathway VirB2 component (pilin)